MKISEDRNKHDFAINKFIKNELEFNENHFLNADELYPISNSDELDFRVRVHRSVDYEKDPNLLEILIPTSSDSHIYSGPFGESLEDLGGYHKRHGVYVFYGYSSNLKPQVLYVGESTNLWGRIVQHISGNSNLKSIIIKGKIFEPFKYIRWVEIFDLDNDNANHRKLLEQVMIAVKKPLHNNFKEDRVHSAKIDYYNYLEKETSITNEIVHWPERDWNFDTLEWE